MNVGSRDSQGIRNGQKVWRRRDVEWAVWLVNVRSGRSEQMEAEGGRGRRWSFVVSFICLNLRRARYNLRIRSMKNAYISIVNPTRCILMFVPCIIRRSRNDQQYALICTTTLFYIKAPTCFGSSLPSSGSFLGPSELHEIQIEWAVYHIKYVI
jgi:hypothetical protein